MANKTETILTRLYETSDAVRDLEAMLIAHEGDITDLEGEFTVLSVEAEKYPAAVDDVLCIVRDIESRADARKAEAARITVRAKRDSSVADWFRSQVLRSLMERGQKKIETARWRATVAAPGGKSSLDIVGDVPDEYMTIVTTAKVDTDKIRAALDRGEVLPFAFYSVKQPYLRIS